MATDSKDSLMWWLGEEVLSSPVNVVLLSLIVYMVYKMFLSDSSSSSTSSSTSSLPSLPPLKRQDLTLQQLRAYDGNGEDGRVLMAVNGKVFDVTKGKRFYGPGGPYADFAGRDASRGLATFTVKASDADEWDDLSDLKPSEMDQVREWELQFEEKYHLVGKLLRPGEEPTNYDEVDEEDAKQQEEGGEGDGKKEK